MVMGMKMGELMTRMIMTREKKKKKRRRRIVRTWVPSACGLALLVPGAAEAAAAATAMARV
jgi:hypothetical protein